MIHFKFLLILHRKKECPKRKPAGGGTAKEAVMAEEFQDGEEP